MVVALKKEGTTHTIMDHLPCPGPTSATKEVPLGKGCIWIRIALDKTTFRMLIGLFQKNEDIFAWDLKDLKGVSHEVAEHKLVVTPSAFSVQ